MENKKPYWLAFKNSTADSVEIHLYDEIGFWGVGAKDFIAELRQHTGKHVHLRINSPGGEVIDGTAIFNALSRHQGGVTVHIDALAASMASVIAMVGNPVLMADNALLMIHDPYTFAGGTSEDLRKSADLLDTMKSNLVRAYAKKTGMPDDEIRALMAAETWLTATEAVALGFVDSIEEGMQAAAVCNPSYARARFDTMKSIMANATITPEEIPAADEPVIEPETVVIEEPAAPVEPSADPKPTADEPAAPIEAAQNSVDVSAITAQLQAAYDRLNAAEARAQKAEAALATVQETLARLERSKGLAPAATVPEVKPFAANRTVLTKAEFDTLTPYQKSEFFRQGGKLTE